MFLIKVLSLTQLESRHNWKLAALIQPSDRQTETDQLQINVACILLDAPSEKQEAQLSPSDRAMRLVSSNLANYHATVQRLLIRQVLAKPMV